MELLDTQYTKTPFYGVSRMPESFRQAGHSVNPKPIIGLMDKMGLQAICHKKKLDLSHHGKVYPYLLKGLGIDRPDQVWVTFAEPLRHANIIRAVRDVTL